MSTTLSTVNSATGLLSNETNNAVAATGLLMNAANGNRSALSQTTSNSTSSQTTTHTNQLTSTNANLFNLSRGMKENSIFIAAINQINQSGNNKQAIMNGILQQQQNQTKQQLANNLVQQQQFNNSTTTVPQQNATTNLQQTANCQQQQPFYQQLSALRLKSLHNNSQSLLNNQQAMYRAFQNVQQVNNSNSLKQQQHQLLNNLNQGVLNQASATGQQSNTGNILLNISNHNNHTNSHFNHFNQHQTNQTLYNGLPLNYHLQNGQTHHFYHSNSLSSSPRSSTSSNSSSTSSSLINYNNNNQNGNVNKYQQQQQQQQNASTQQQHSPASNNSSNTAALNTNANQQQNNCQNKQLNAKKLKNNQQQQQNLNLVQQQQTIQGQNGNSSRYKTELCRPYEESGFCKYSDKCQYAHGPAELRSLIRHPKYKTELCKTYHSTGFCPYGRRCNFVHNDNPSSTTTISSAASTMQTPNTLLTATSKKENINTTNLNTSAILMDSFLSGASTVLNGLNSTNSGANLANKVTIADLIEINTNAPSSGISSMGSNTNSIDSVGSSPSTSPKQTIFPNLNQSQQLKKQNSNKLQELILPLSPGLSIGSGNSSPLQQLSSLSSKSDDVFYKYL